MNPRVIAFRTGLARGWIEFRHNRAQAFGYAFFPALALTVMCVMRGNTVAGTGVSLGTRAIPGIIAMNVVFTGLTRLASALMMEREDGTLLRAKATPNGVLGYLTGKVVSQAAMIIATSLIVMISAGFLFEGLRLNSIAAWLTLVWVMTLGMVATLPFGATVGSLFKNPLNLRYISLLTMGLVAISGVFYPLGALPQWIQWIGQIFPLYWISLGMRSAMLPDAPVATEIGASWRFLETSGVLRAWAIFGFVVAPAILRRMARRESGSSVTSRREKRRQPSA
ncbi:ABC transporter permease (plasmid) [Streptosporangium sp. CA-135522]|uniref:ABC transporter permease n=1 Tax=Streptosporangium sp. CA-135522 TaxID=3240072 RepID=UPI003D8EC9C8